MLTVGEIDVEYDHTCFALRRKEFQNIICRRRYEFPVPFPDLRRFAVDESLFHIDQVVDIDSAVSVHIRGVEVAAFGSEVVFLTGHEHILVIRSVEVLGSERRTAEHKLCHQNEVGGVHHTVVIEIAEVTSLVPLCLSRHSGG